MDHSAHKHHQMVMETTNEPSTSSFTTVPTVAGTLLQTILTTVMSHSQHQHHKLTPEHPPSHFSNSNFLGAESDPSNVENSHVHSANSPGGGHDMVMHFHSGVDAVILFKEWNISTTEGLIISVLGIFFMALLYEGIKFFREQMFKKYFTSLEYSSVSVVGDDGNTVTEVHKVARNRMLSWPHMVQTILHVVQMVLSYFLMLIFMTYNVWLCLGVVLGAGTGYFLFGWKKATVVDITEHCH